MTKEETVKIITLITMAYPAVEKFTDETIVNMTEIWSKFFVDDPYNLVETAVQYHISTQKWVPTIAEIRQRMARLRRPDLIPPEEAWKAVIDYLYAESDLFGDMTDVFPPIIAEVIKTITVPTLKRNSGGKDKLMFMDLYEPAYNKELEMAVLPKALRTSIETAENATGGEAKRQIAYIRRVRKDKESEENERIYKKYRKFTELVGGS